MTGTLNIGRALMLSVLVLLGAAGAINLVAANETAEAPLTTVDASELERVRNARILFLHHSVGADILKGIRALDEAAGGAGQVRIVNADAVTDAQGGALIEFSGGRNTEPKSKIDGFAQFIRGNAKAKPELAFLKLCYVDFNPSTDVDELFAYYRATIEALKREHPEIKFAHVSAPLHAWPSEIKWRAYRLIGKEVWEDSANAKRARYNQLLKETFASDPIFDLSTVEATAPDGTLTSFRFAGKDVLALYPGYTEDGGHLNAAGQRVAGSAAIHFLAGALTGGSKR